MLKAPIFVVALTLCSPRFGRALSVHAHRPPTTMPLRGDPVTDLMFESRNACPSTKLRFPNLFAGKSNKMLIKQQKLNHLCAFKNITRSSDIANLLHFVQ